MLVTSIVQMVGTCEKLSSALRRNPIQKYKTPSFFAGLMVLI
jgi:hypothetical protein